MGDAKRTILFGVAIAGIVASLLLPWWRADLMGASLEVTLRHVEVCAIGICQSVDAGGAYGIVGMMTFAYGWVAVVALILGGLMPALAGERPKARAYVVAIVYMAFAALAYGTLNIPDEIARSINLDSTWWFWAGIAGCALVLGSPLLDLLDRRPSPTARPILETVAPAPLPVARALAPVNLPGPPPVVAAPAAAAPLSRSGLRFALATAEAGETALRTVDEDGQRRELPWSRIGGALARELSAQRLDDPLLVDLIPRGEAPLRVLTTTRIALPGSEPTSGRDALRRLLAFARAMNPDLELEASTADFLYKRTELPAWSPPQLDAYDARY